MSDLLCGGICKDENLSVKAVRIVMPWKGLCQRCYEKYERKEFCAGCLEQGRKHFATVKLNGLFLCREHSRSAAIEEAPPQALEVQDVEVKKEKPMQGRKAPDLDWAQLQRERDAGASVEELRKKYHTSWPTINKHTTPPKGGKLSRIAEGAVEDAKRHYTKRAPAPKPPRTGEGYSSVLVALRAKRDAYIRAVEALEQVEA